MGKEAIANLNITPSQVTGRLATWHRLMEEAGLTYNDLQIPIDDPEFRQNLIAFWQSRTLLEPVNAANVAGTKEFLAKEHFKLGESAGVKISYLGDNFNDHFLKKREENITEVMLKSFKLTQASLSPPIITALGDNHETYLAQLWELLKLQPQGETGILLTNGYVNIFYIRDADGILWAVCVRWFGDGWCVYAGSVEDPYWWRAGDQVFGR